MLTAIVVVFYTLVIVFDFLPLSKRQPKKDSYTYIMFMTVSFIIVFLFSLGIKFPSISEPIKNLLDNIG